MNTRLLLVINVMIICKYPLINRYTGIQVSTNISFILLIVVLRLSFVPYQANTNTTSDTTTDNTNDDNANDNNSSTNTSHNNNNEPILVTILITILIMSECGGSSLCLAV